MKIITEKITITENGEIISGAIKITDFSRLNALAAIPLYNNEDNVNKVLASISVSANHIDDSPVMMEIVSDGNNQRKVEPLYFFKDIVPGTNINFQVMDLELAGEDKYPYDIIIIFYCE